MSDLYIPSFDEIMEVAASRGEDSDATHLWHKAELLVPSQDGGGLTAHDMSGNGNHGTLTNMDPATDWVVTEKGRALDFDGTNDYVNCGSGTHLIVYGNVSVGAWANFDLFSDHGSSLIGQMLIGYGADGDLTSNNVAYLLGVNASKTLTFFWEYDAGVNAALASTVPAGVNVGEWHHYFATRETTSTNTVRFYLDGQQLGDVVSNSNNANSSGTNTQALLGGLLRVSTGVSVYQFQGKQTLASIHSRALLPSEIQQLYADPWAMYRLRTKVFPAAVAASGAKTIRIGAGLLNASVYSINP